MHNRNYPYALLGYKLNIITLEKKDLAVIVDSSMKTSAQSTVAVKKQARCQDVLSEGLKENLKI